MRLYPLFILMATITVFSPGPGVLMTLTNSMHYGFRHTIGGIFGIAFGAIIVASISAAGVGVLVATSALAFTILKYIGAAYLTYLGWKLWRSPTFEFGITSKNEASFGGKFLEGLSLQMTNPKVIFFFLSVFPQFIDRSANYSAQFSILVLTYSILVILIHCFYAVLSRHATQWLTSKSGGRMINKLGGATFMCFGAALAMARR